ncbi:aldehyde dehydrogenase family protein [Ancylomarina euxinus]|uniref:Aldehyde dehydrogenase family protein n=1 Tax=Ancylomarina euxinus TaxID=2283627 RepID=A0A425Y5U7_9BACT|nr:aldehyde dehydrogenase family protein [Ancylomarina euxinus]MCZ4694190.1 aldehyde dehydrogenase family protein [Ancylomarina euxinus]MUP14479.1 aldehyde dehydrogenase family protein [Ancylomarina euxinus]RRG23780.1 aldehyde dehydrogenase family protein [Ancylomarina euxinus]
MTIIKVKSPFDGRLLQEIPLMDSEIVEEKMAKAYALFQDRSRWLKPYERIAILERTKKLMESRVEDLTKIAASEGGKPYQDSKVEVLRAINGVQLAIEYIGQIKGDQIPMGMTAASLNRLAFSMPEPIGVVLSISAFNHPLNLAVHQIIPAFAVGCPVIIKPASSTPMSAIELVKIMKEAGLPADWAEVVICNRENAELMVKDSRVNYFSFIGSAEVGWALRSKLAPGTHCAMEHGGSAPVIVEADTDIDEAISLLGKGAFYHAGQVCVSVQRVFVHDSIMDEFSKKLVVYAKSIKVGDPLDPFTEVGPMIDSWEQERVHTWVNEAVKEGAELLFGGRKCMATCYQPSILLNPSEDSKVSKLEVFGPVVCLYTYSKLQEAIDRSNSLDLAFQASIFTKNMDKALDAVSQLNASAVMVNDHTAFRVDWMPFGGRDASGIGVGGIPYSMKEMTRDKLMVIRSKSI